MEYRLIPIAGNEYRLFRSISHERYLVRKKNISGNLSKFLKNYRLPLARFRDIIKEKKTRYYVTGIRYIRNDKSYCYHLSVFQSEKNK